MLKLDNNKQSSGIKWLSILNKIKYVLTKQSQLLHLSDILIFIPINLVQALALVTEEWLIQD